MYFIISIKAPPFAKISFEKDMCIIYDDYKYIQVIFVKFAN